MTEEKINITLYTELNTCYMYTDNNGLMLVSAIIRK